MKVSIITATFNSAATIADCISSVNNQTWSNIEHIIIDGGSQDDTISIINSLSNRVTQIISESDKGLYDAMNKGLKLATGDVVGFLNSDDFYSDSDALFRIVKAFEDEKIDAVYADICFVRPDNLNRIVRYYSSKFFTPSFFRFGFMPAHPTFYVKRVHYEKLGYYRTNYHISADFELMIRYLYIAKLKTKYIDYCLVTMRTGGVSTRNIKSNYTLNKEILDACRKNGIYTNWLIVMPKYFFKLFGLIIRNRKNRK